MKELQIFKNEEFGEIQILENNNKYEFEATGAAKILKYVNPYDAIIRHCKKDGVVKHEVIDNLGRKQEKNFISESNLYRLITHSKLPEAEKFENWVFEEVLPSIRKNGGYIAGQENLSDNELMAKALLVAQNTINNKDKQLEEANKKIKADEGKVLYANCLTKQGTILVGEMATILAQNGVDIGEKRLFEWLRNNGYLDKSKGREHNKPTRKSTDLEIMRFTKTVITHSNGYQDSRITPLITGKGQIYFINKFKGLLKDT